MEHFLIRISSLEYVIEDDICEIDGQNLDMVEMFNNNELKDFSIDGNHAANDLPMDY